jgi:hypothetical protein
MALSMTLEAIIGIAAFIIAISAAAAWKQHHSWARISGDKKLNSLWPTKEGKPIV